MKFRPSVRLLTEPFRVECASPMRVDRLEPLYTVLSVGDGVALESPVNALD
jgi:hypothetical protein